MIWDYGGNGLDLAICCMYNYCRVTSLACNIKDGTVIKAERLRKRKSAKELTLTELGVDLKKRELKYAIEKMPSFYHFMCYMYFCGAAISGPWYEFQDFENMIDLKEDFANVPSTLKPALRRYLDAWLCVIVGTLFDHFFDHNFMLTESFAELPIYKKVLYSWGSLKNMMYLRYMVGWCLMEVGPIASGLSFSGYDENGEPKWDRVKSCNIWRLETSYKVKDFLANWNISAHNWLKYYVYLR